MIRAVLFDVGGVLTPPLRSIVGPVVLASGVDVVAMRDVLLPMFSSAADGDEPGHRLERGEIDVDTFLTELGPIGASLRVVMDAASPHFLGMSFAPHEGMQALVSDVRAAGLLTGVLSNTVAEWMPAWARAVARPELFDAIVYSCEVGLRKPNPAIYRLAAERLGVEPREVLFIDDFAPMVAGAQAVGMEAIELRDHDHAIALVRQRLGLNGDRGAPAR